MALYLPPTGPVFDPPAIVQAAPAWVLVGPLAALMADYAPPRALTCIFDELNADHRPAVKLAIMQQLLFATGGTSYINSVQQVSITITAGTSNTGTVNVVSANAFPVWQGCIATGSGADAATSSPRITFSISAGVMTLTATLNTSGTCTVNVSVIDPTASLVTAMVSGTIAVTTTGTATGLTLSTTLSAVFYLGQTSTDATELTAGRKTSIGLQVTNTTTITAFINSGGTVTAAYVAVTFAAGALQSNVQQFATTKSTLTSNTQAVTSVVAANSIIAWGGVTQSVSSAFSGVPDVVLTNGTTMTFTSNATAAFTAYTTVIEFVAGVLKSSQYGTVAISSSTSGTSTPGTAVTTSKTCCAFLGATGAGTTDATTAIRITLTNGTPTITGTVQTSSSPTAGYGLYEFK